MYSPGGDPLSPDAFHHHSLLDMDAWDVGNVSGRFLITLLNYDANSPDEQTQAMRETFASWVVVFQYNDPCKPSVFSASNAAHGHGDNTKGTPSFVGPLGLPPLLFDYDGDGTPEAGVYETDYQHALPPVVRLRVWTLRDGSVVPYAPTRNLNAVGITDSDDDGRPDLLLDSRATFLGADECQSDLGDPDCQPSRHSSFSPDGLAHSLKVGTFSLDDTVASAFAKEAKE